MVELTSRQHARTPVSCTFEGRDRFAPAAAWLAGGGDIADLGAPVATLAPLPGGAARRIAGGVEGTIVRVDRFGSLITNIDGPLLGGHVPVEVHVGGQVITRMVTTYSEAPADTLCALLGSADGRLLFHSAVRAALAR